MFGPPKLVHVALPFVTRHITVLLIVIEINGCIGRILQLQKVTHVGSQPWALGGLHFAIVTLDADDKVGQDSSEKEDTDEYWAVQLVKVTSVSCPYPM